MQETCVWSLVWEDPIGRRATKPLTCHVANCLTEQPMCYKTECVRLWSIVRKELRLLVLEYTRHNPLSYHWVNLAANPGSVEPWDDYGPSWHFACVLARDPELGNPAEPHLIWARDCERIRGVVSQAPWHCSQSFARRQGSSTSGAVLEFDFFSSLFDSSDTSGVCPWPRLPATARWRSYHQDLCDVQYHVPFISLGIMIHSLTFL